MRLADFIVSDLELILEAWTDFAKTKISVGSGMTDLALRDDAADILREVARDMATPQSEGEQQSKSRGDSDSQRPAKAALAHGLQRSRSGFEVNQMVSEFRAMRATVLRLWTASAPDAKTWNLEDVTRFNEAIDEALAESLKRFVGEVDRARSLFLGVLGHDLRTPLSTIATCASLLDLHHPGSARETGMIRRSAQRMRELVDVVFAYTRSSLGKPLPVDLKPTDLAELAQHCVRELSLPNPTRRIELETSGDLQGSWDATRLAQLISNLVGNALKYGAPDTPVTVTLNGTDEHEVTLHVHNLGVAIEPALLQDIFEPLVRGSTPAGQARAGGADMGLGLYIAREVAAAHPGTIRVRSDAVEGTTFDVRLPRSPLGTR